MATRPPDFKASGLRTERIIASGSLTNPRLLIIGSGSTNSDGVTVNTSTIKLTGTGSDTWLYVSGAIGGTDRVTFGGDVYISGSLLGVSTGGGSGNWNELSPTPRLNTTASVAIAGGLGFSYAAQSRGSDIFFFVSGTNGGSPTSDKVSVFGGDLRVSGVLAVEGGIISASNNPTLLFGNVGSSNQFYVRHAKSPSNEPVAIFYDRTSAYSLEISGGLVVNSQQTTGYGDLQVYGKGTQTTLWSDSGTGRLFLSGNQVTVNSLAVHGGADVNFFVSGARGSRNTGTRGTSLVSGDVVVSGSTYFGTANTDTFVMNSALGSSIVPNADRQHNLGSPTLRFANMYTGDLHLKNDRGDWTVIEEPDFLRIVNNRTGKSYKMMMEPID